MNSPTTLLPPATDASRATPLLWQTLLTHPDPAARDAECRRIITHFYAPLPEQAQ